MKAKGGIKDTVNALQQLIFSSSSEAKSVPPIKPTGSPK
jgi:hypothetical protein